MGYTLGLGGPYHHDASACLVDDAGAIVAFVEEERLSRRKHNKDSRSCTRAAAFCLSSAGIRLPEVSDVVVAWNPHWPVPTDRITDTDLIGEILDPQHFGGYRPAALEIVDHHLAHAASAFYPSGFPESAVLVADGSGDGVSTSLFRGHAGGLELVHQYPFTESLGWFYETVAEYTGLGDWTSTGKLMGLAAYGSPVHEFDFLRVAHDGYCIDLSGYGLPAGAVPDGDYRDLAYYRRLKKAYGAAFAALGVSQRRTYAGYDGSSGRFGGAGDGFAAEHLNLAASAQQALEQCLLSLARTALSAADSSRLCVAGGVGLNCSANGVLQRNCGATEFFVQPAAGDAGCAIGAALEHVRRAGRLSVPGVAMRSAALGPAFDDGAIGAVLDACGVRYAYHGDDIVAPVARALAADRIVGWFQGATEAGPRALGQRSILANPGTVASRDRVNCDIKHREMWRPLAPSILAEASAKLITDPGAADFMIVAYQATDEAREVLPATVHVDGSLRPQIVDPMINPLFAGLLRAVGDETGVPAVLNTSFNHEAEPIVCTPIDSLRTFFSTPLDMLAIGGFLVTKDRPRTGAW
ncbi:carbamoyltransferase family protein [Dactylosporangium matsuzakiense]|uniref:Carbamoyltransferase n=1 Tax=Dactylosporangium matsuzakiense TaxID=53360 RepID=A0A9W6NLM8_9ACTN|nr:carbamoyltransferase C-terminal domain-containing protein [Dactylosporangium matsuzakiense]GLL02125.1 carbamoyltransferase [Dactylosporangium matsuzakiense]